MKKRFFLCLMAALVSFGGGCSRKVETGRESSVTSGTGDESENSGAESKYSYQDTIFRYAGEEYDLSERDSMINDISECIPVGKYVIVDCHTGPHNGIYSFFNTETEEFEKDIAGALLTFHDDDVNTIVYAFWQDIYAYDGELLASFELEEGDDIRDISYNGDYTKLEIKILTAEGDSRTEEVELL